MSDKTGIEWTDATWNPVTGCTKVSAGCKHCYAEREWPRMTRLVPAYAGRDFTDVRTHADRLDQPLRWKRPRKVFVNSMSDLFHPDVPDWFIDRVFAVMAMAPQHVFQVLTKRAKRMRDYIAEGGRASAVFDFMRNSEIGYWAGAENLPPQSWPLQNVWLGVSVEDQDAADERIPLLLDTPAAVRWISAEPLLGPVDASRYMWPVHARWPAKYKSPDEAKAAGEEVTYHRQGLVGAWCKFIDWVVVGGESGPKARPMHPQWARDLRDRCAAAGVPFLFKQWGEWNPISQQSEEFTKSLYVSNRKAAPDEDQRIIDELYGCSCTVEQTVQHMDGSLHHFLEPNAFKAGAMTTYRVGKKRAGRLLDGVTHDGYPEGGDA